jgi:nitrite reductase/ring-hydroxylating ferredoxin subunit
VADTWTRVISLGDLEEEELTAVELAGESVLLFRMGDRVSAVGGRCTHAGMPLAGAAVDFEGDDPFVTCPAHGSRFLLEDGRVVRPPAPAPLPRYRTRVIGDQVEIAPVA